MNARCLGNLHRPAAGTSGRAVVPVRGNAPRPRHPPVRVQSGEKSAMDASISVSGALADVLQRRKDLELELKLAVKGEDFKEAARLRDELEALNRQDPVVSAKRALESAIREERYEDAAKISAQIKALEEELGPAALAAGLLSTTSTANTRGIKVAVQSFFLPTKSQPSAGRFMFAYHVTITNESELIVQLRNRHWVIMDGQGKKEEVRGPGVVGEQPILLPGKTHEYTSGCALPTPQGSMEGEYSMVVLSAEDGQWADTMEVKIGKFMLDARGPQAI